MKRWFLLVGGILLAAMGGCTEEGDPVLPPVPGVYTATGDFFNLLVGDGSVDTRTSFRQGNDIKLGDHILPNGGAIDRGLLLGSPAQASALRFFLTEGDSTILNPGEVFNLNSGGDYVFLALGDVRHTSGETRPTLLQVDALADPPTGQVRFRFSHALTGWTGAVDVHVNGEILENIRYGDESEPIVFDARVAGQDSLVVVPTGEDPDGPLALWGDRGDDIFDAGETIDAFLVHEPHLGVNGDVAGDYEVLFVQQ